MKTDVISLVALIAALCVVSVNSQALQGSAPPAGQPATPPAVSDAVQKLQTDIQQMKAAGNIDQVVVMKDVQAISDAVKASLANAPQQIQSQFAQIQSSIDQMKGKPDPKQISSLIQSFLALINSQSIASIPGAATNGKTTKAKSG